MESAQNAAKASGEGAAGHLKPGYCYQNAAKACGKGAARHLEAGKCLTLLSEAIRKALGKRPEGCKSLRRRRRQAVDARLLPPECSNSLWQGQLQPGYCPQNAATACGKGAARHLEAGKCLILLSEATRKALGKRPECCKSLRRRRRGHLKPGYCPQNAATARGKGAARDLEAGKCLTLLSEATREALGKRPECCKSLRRRRREAVEARLLPPECSNSLWQGRREAFGGKQVANVAF